LQVKEVSVAARRRNARLSFAFVYPNNKGGYNVREVRLRSLHNLDQISCHRSHA